MKISKKFLKKNYNLRDLALLDINQIIKVK